MKLPKKTLVIRLFAVLSAIIIGFFVNFYLKNDTKNKSPEISQKKDPVSDMIVIEYPKPHDIVTSPLVIKGRARGTWLFEGSFPVTLYYGEGKDFIETFAMVEGEWMTENFIPFTLTINFPEPYVNDGLLILKRNNPSDIREQDMSLSIPLRFR